MKDAYSFDAGPDGLDKSYELQREAYLRIFERCGLDVRIVRASSGAMGGGDCEEFMVLSDAGDDEIVHCPSCGYAANQEVAESEIESVEGTPAEREKVHTPEKRTIEEVSGFLGVEPSFLVKSLAYVTESGEKVFVLIRGDHQVDEGKLEAILGPCRAAEPAEVKELTGADIGFVSPVNVSGAEVIADPALEGMKGLVCGANENDYHFTGIEMGRDISPNRYVRLKAVEAGETCIHCGKTLEVARAIEVGHIFKLGTRYSEAIGAEYLDDNGESHPIVMGSYGIGVERIMACAIEANFDEKLMVWPREITPFMAEILPLNVTIDEVRETAETLYNNLREQGVETLLDDRDDRAGVKFNDADLIGAPIVVVIGGRNLKEGLVELRIRDHDISEKVKADEVLGRIMDDIRQ
jgi:prolyl-tRNA synthetase